MTTQGSQASTRIALAVALTAAAGCYTGLSNGREDAANASDTDDGVGDGADDGAGSAGDDPQPAEWVPRQGLRRLSVAEYDQTVRDLLGIPDLPALELLPADPRTPFDNDYTEQIPSEALVNATDFLAEQLADEVLADPILRDSLIGCVPQDPSDATCMRDFIERFGRRALRRPLTETEIDRYLNGPTDGDGALAHAEAEGDFDAGVEFLIRAMLADAEFLYRIEIGQPVPGVPGLVRLGPYEVATRLSFLLWGSGPDDALLDRAAAGDLDTPDGIGEAATDMLADPRAIARIDRFHAMWLGYESMFIDGELAAQMRGETMALLQRIVFEDRRVWHDVFREPATFINAALAEHYGLPAPDGEEPAWVDYGDSGRQGLLSHGAFLSVGAQGEDTSPVQRGLVIRRRLFCEEIPPPPPTVNVDDEPPAVDGFCKVERFAAHREGDCAGCHALLDPVGFGLENYDPLGRFRTHEPDNPQTPDDESQCEIAGEGELAGVGPFNGPAELANLALGSGKLDLCVARQLHRLTVGRGVLGPDDTAIVTALRDRLGEGEFRFDELLTAIVTDPAFAYRREDVKVVPPGPSDPHPDQPATAEEKP